MSTFLYWKNKGQMAEIKHQRPKLQSIYDALFDFESKNREVPYAIHKKVRIEGKPLLNWLAPQLNITASKRVLDAGCGTGNTLFHLHKYYGCAGVGLSISSKEVAFANNYARSMKLQGELQFFQRDFSHSLLDMGNFDLIVAIESLKHCQDPIGVVLRLRDLLNPGGQLLVVDDFLFDNEVAKKEVQKHQEAWDAPGFIALSILTKALRGADLSLNHVNLTSFVRSKPLWKLNLLLKAIRTAKALTKQKSGTYQNLSTYEGALVLEKLYNQGVVGYSSIMAYEKG